MLPDSLLLLGIKASQGEGGQELADFMIVAHRRIFPVPRGQCAALLTLTYGAGPPGDCYRPVLSERPFRSFLIASLILVFTVPRGSASRSAIS